LKRLLVLSAVLPSIADLFESNQPLAQMDQALSAIKNEAYFNHPRASRELRLGGILVAYELIRGKRRSIGFRVGADGLAVRAPNWVSLRDIDAALQTKSAWILRKLQESRERQARLAAQVITWKDGATLPFLGQSLTIELDPAHRFGPAGAQLVILPLAGAVLAVAADALAAPGLANAAPLDLPPVSRPVLRLGLPHHALPEQIRAAVQAWLMRQASRIFQERLDHFAPLLGVKWKKLALSNAVTRWGSARHDGAIRLNWRLLHFRLAVIDYVVAHELSHLREMNHSPRFWDTVRSVVPDYAALRQQLKSEAQPRWQ
jgi:predicted metal-dependent hydrolase